MKEGISAREIDPLVLRSILRYEPSTGRLFWLPRSESLFPDGRYSAARSCLAWNSRYAEREAFTAVRDDGYRVGTVFGKDFRANRVIWAIVTGSWPSDVVDHKDQDPSNNRWSNLRAATKSQNQCNRRSAAGSSSSFLGVSFFKRTKRWTAQISVGGQQKRLGYFASEIAAALAYDAAARKYHASFARPNFSAAL